MTSNTAIDFRLLEAIGFVFLSSIEGELVSMTYGVTRLLKQEVTAQQSILNSLAPATNPSEFKLEDVDVLIGNLADVVEQLRQQNLTVAHLETRMTGLEESLAANSTRASEPAPSGSTIAVSELRLHAIEDSLNSVELLAGGLGQQDEDLLKMNQRLSNLESLLGTLSHLPDLMGQQHQIIAGMDERLRRLEDQRLVDRELRVREIEPDRVF